MVRGDSGDSGDIGDSGSDSDDSGDSTVSFFWRNSKKVKLF
jgi:hypothetical protein